MHNIKYEGEYEDSIDLLEFTVFYVKWMKYFLFDFELNIM